MRETYGMIKIQEKTSKGCKAKNRVARGQVVMGAIGDTAGSKYTTFQFAPPTINIYMRPRKGLRESLTLAPVEKRKILPGGLRDEK